MYTIKYVYLYRDNVWRLQLSLKNIDFASFECKKNQFLKLKWKWNWFCCWAFKCSTIFSHCLANHSGMLKFWINLNFLKTAAAVVEWRKAKINLIAVVWNSLSPFSLCLFKNKKSLLQCQIEHDYWKLFIFFVVFFSCKF